MYSYRVISIKSKTNQPINIDNVSDLKTNQSINIDNVPDLKTNQSINIDNIPDLKTKNNKSVQVRILTESEKKDIELYMILIHEEKKMRNLSEYDRSKYVLELISKERKHTLRLISDINKLPIIFYNDCIYLLKVNVPEGIVCKHDICRKLYTASKVNILNCYDMYDINTIKCIQK